MSERNFEKWLSTFKKSINSYQYYTDFDKVFNNIEKLKMEICALDTLIGAKNIELEFDKVMEKCPKCIKVLPLLLAVRSLEIFCKDEKGEIEYNFKYIAHSLQDYKYFMDKTGLFSMLKDHKIKSLYDYLVGVEVGLDSNARKNRGGKQMENLVEKYIRKEKVEYYSQMELSEVEEKWNVDLSPISANGTTQKKWDFVVKTRKNIYAIEVNFYTSSGSKLNETARSYKKIAEESKQIPDFYFVWITDGEGWKETKNNLKETFDVLDNLYNISDLESGCLQKLFK